MILGDVTLVYLVFLNKKKKKVQKLYIVPFSCHCKCTFASKFEVDVASKTASCEREISSSKSFLNWFKLDIFEERLGNFNTWLNNNMTYVFRSFTENFSNSNLALNNLYMYKSDQKNLIGYKFFFVFTDFYLFKYLCLNNYIFLKTNE